MCTSNRSPCVIVFDIDGTLCHHRHTDLEVKSKFDPECHSVHVCNMHFTFKPYVEVLLKYLVDQKCRVVFFSAADDIRNEPLVAQLMETCFGNSEYLELVKQGQFKVFSEHHMEFNFFIRCHARKNLCPILLEGETLEDIILVEDSPSYVAAGQSPCILMLDSSGDNIYSGKSSKMELFAKNGVYYLLGVFKTYFECDKYANLSLRESIKQIIPFSTVTRVHKPCYVPEYHSQLRFIHTGLQEVRKTVPNALFYGSVWDLDTRDPDGVPPADALTDNDFRHPDGVTPASIMSSNTSSQYGDSVAHRCIKRRRDNK